MLGLVGLAPVEEAAGTPTCPVVFSVTPVSTSLKGQSPLQESYNMVEEGYNVIQLCFHLSQHILMHSQCAVRWVDLLKFPLYYHDAR